MNEAVATHNKNARPYLGSIYSLFASSARMQTYSRTSAVDPIADGTKVEAAHRASIRAVWQARFRTASEIGAAPGPFPSVGRSLPCASHPLRGGRVMTDDPIPFPIGRTERIEPSPSPPYSEDAIALELIDDHNFYLRYVAAWKSWMLWEQGVWRRERTLWIYDQIRALCRRHAAFLIFGLTTEKRIRYARQLVSAKTVAGIAQLARTDRRISALPDQWDTDPMLLNTPSGVVDLVTGKLGISRPDDYMTKLTAVAPAATADCPLWIDFLNQVTDGDQALRKFLQRMIGYALTGKTIEHAMFFCWGTGGNGKSVFVETIAGILGIITAPRQSRRSRPRRPIGTRPNSPACEGRVWFHRSRPNRVAAGPKPRSKQLTGGDRIAARFMRQDFFEFVPQFKLIVAGNHKPSLRSVDEAIKRPFNLVPFTVTIPKEKRDLQLSEKLRSEWPAILRWTIDGCLEWQRIGLEPPAAVRNATAAYLESEDAVSAWLDDCCIVDPKHSAPSAHLFASWRAWAERNGEFAGSQKRLTQTLETKGFERMRHGGVRVIAGLRLNDAGSDKFDPPKQAAPRYGENE